MQPGDVPALLDRLAEQNARDGTSYRLPQVFDGGGARLSRVPLALVAVDAAGKVAQGHIYERTVEQMSFGISAAATLSSIREQDAVFYLLRARGYTDLHMLVPEERAAGLGRGLDELLRMTPTAGRLRHF